MKLPTHEDWMNEKFVETVMKAKDIDGAYAAAMDIFSCKLDDILAVFSHAPINVKEKVQPRAVHRQCKDLCKIRRCLMYSM